MIHLWFDVVPLQILDARDVDFVVKVTNVADNRLVAHVCHVCCGDDVFIARGGDENIRLSHHVIERDYAVAFHRRLQSTNRVDFGNHHGRAQTTQRLRRAFAHVAITADHRDFTRNHHIGGAFDAIDQRLAAAVQIIKF